MNEYVLTYTSEKLHYYLVSFYAGNYKSKKEFLKYYFPLSNFKLDNLGYLWYICALNYPK